MRVRGGGRARGGGKARGGGRAGKRVKVTDEVEENARQRKKRELEETIQTGDDLEECMCCRHVELYVDGRPQNWSDSSQFVRDRKQGLVGLRAAKAVKVWMELQRWTVENEEGKKWYEE